jgi:hypothetical protein
MLTFLKITVVGVMLTAAHHPHVAQTTFMIPFDSSFACEEQLPPSEERLADFFSAAKRVNPKMLPRAFNAECVATGNRRI